MISFTISLTTEIQIVYGLRDVKKRHTKLVVLPTNVNLQRKFIKRKLFNKKPCELYEIQPCKENGMQPCKENKMQPCKEGM